MAETQKRATGSNERGCRYKAGRLTCCLASAFALLLLNAMPLRAEAIFRTVTIAWNASPANGVVGYRVLYGTQSGVYPNVIDVGPNLSCDVANLIDGTTYYFAVTAYDSSAAMSAPSEEFVHTVNPGVLLNISARAKVQTGDDVLIAGFIIGGSSRKTVVVRALGPSLREAGIAQPLGDPQLEIFAPGGALIAANDNWADSNPEAIASYHLAPTADAEPALIVTLAPGSYTAVVRGVGGATGVSLVEVYDVGVPVP